MLRQFIVLIICFFVSCSLSAQVKVDTVYIKGERETTKDSAKHLRVRTTTHNRLMAADYSMNDSSIRCAGYYKSFNPYIQHGNFKYYHSMDTISAEGEYSNNKKTGVWKNYFRSGEFWYSQEYVNGVENGSLKSYYKSGEIKRIEKYKDGKLKEGKCYTKSGNDTTFYEMFILPQFPGGDSIMIEYFKNNLTYPRRARALSIQGIVYVQYTILEDGSVQNVVVTQGAHSLLNKAAVEFVEQMPKWTPGYVDGVASKFKRIVPVSFTLK